jgi:hypothetical protein
MNKICLSFVAVAALSWPACGQKVEIRKPDRGQIVHVETSLDHLTVLEMGEPVITVAVGSSAFKVEWRENKVFIEPTDTNVATNLFVWTESGRFNYELDSAGAVPQMDFAIDQPAIDPPMPSKVLAKSADLSPADVLIQAKSIRLQGSIPEKNRVAVYLTDVLERDGQIFVRYTIRNGTKRTYVPGSPLVAFLNAPRYRESLYGLAYSQLSPDLVERLKSSGETPIEAATGEIRSTRVEPGQETTGIIATKIPTEHTAPAVLRLTFLADLKGPVNATLVF